MACGCQDKANDERIIEYYNNKKRMENEQIIQIRTIRIEWYGNLNDWFIYIPDENKIRNIEKTETGWIAEVEE